MTQVNDATSGVAVSLLGPIEATRDGAPLALGSRQQRALLGVLALQPGRVVPTDALLETLWAGRPPASAPGTLQSYVSRLRRVLGDRELLASDPGGYRLALEPRSVDAVRFEAAVREGREALQQRRFAAASRILDDALALWRGPALADFAYDDWAASEAQRLEAVRLEARADRIDAELALGAHGRLVPELERLAAEHPLDERLRGQLALALYRCGRQAEALEAIRRAREVLRDELGIDPSPPLRRLESQILNQDPALALDDAAAESGAPAAQAAASVLQAAPPIVGLDAGGAVFVGRQRECEALVEALEAAEAGHGRIVFVEGEAGIGKSRLALEAAGRAAERGMQFLHGASYEGGGAPALWPWLPILRGAARLLEAEERAELAAPELFGLLPGLAPAEAAVPAASWAPDADARFRLYEQVIDLLARVAAARPLMLLLDDAHWADAASMHLFELLSHRVVDLPIALVLTVRDGAPENLAFDEARATASRHPWTTHLRLAGLGEQAVAELVAAAGGIAPQRSLVLAIHARTEGNPFFVHELVRLLRDEGLLDEERRALYTGIPAGVRDVVGRRLQALPEQTRSTLELAAVFGRTFALSLLSRAQECPPDECLERLEPALQARLVLRSDGVGVYRFSHAIVRETIVSHLRAPQLVRLHKRAAEALLATGLDDDVAEVAAEHLWQAIDIVDPAGVLPVLERAAAVALRRGAYDSTERLLRRALELSPSDERRLELQLQLASLQMMTLGYSAPEVLEGFRRVSELARSAGKLDQVVQSLHGLASGLAVAGRFTEAREVAERALAAAVELGEPLAVMFGHHIFGIANFHLGRIDVARREFRITHEEWLRAQREGASAFEHAVPPSMIGPAFGALAEYLGGDVEEAHRLRDAMLVAAAEVASPFGYQVASHFAAWLAGFEGDAAAAAAYIEEGSRNVGDNVFPVFATVAPVFTAWERGLRGEPGAAELIDEQLAAMIRIDARTMHHFLLGLKADVLDALGEREAALAALEAGIAESAQRGEAYWLPELHRRRGELLLAEGRRDDALEALARAEQVAAEQGAATLEQRAAASRAACELAA